MAGVGPLQLKVASQLLEAGAAVLEILEASNHPPVSMENALRSMGHWGKMREGMRYWMTIKKARIPFRHSHVPVRALGKEQLRRWWSLRLMRSGASFRGQNEPWKPILCASRTDSCPPYN